MAERQAPKSRRFVRVTGQGPVSAVLLRWLRAVFHVHEARWNDASAVSDPGDVGVFVRGTGRNGNDLFRLDERHGLPDGKGHIVRRRTDCPRSLPGMGLAEIPT